MGAARCSTRVLAGQEEDQVYVELWSAASQDARHPRTITHTEVFNGAFTRLSLLLGWQRCRCSAAHVPVPQSLGGVVSWLGVRGAS